MEADVPSESGCRTGPSRAGAALGAVPRDAQAALIQALLEERPQPSAVTDENGRVIAANGALVTLLGCGRDWLMGRSLHEAISRAGSPPDRPGTCACAAFTTRQRALQHGDRPIGTLWEVAVPSPLAPGAPPGDGPADALPATVARLTAELEATKRELRESARMASLGLVVAGIAHEINTPIGAVSSMHDTLVRAVAKLRTLVVPECPCDSAGEAKVRDLLGFIDDANRVIADGAGRVSAIVKRVRSVARLEDDQLVEADLNQGIEDTVRLVAHELAPRIEITLETAPLPPITCQPARLNQVFLNLVMNAAQAIPGCGRIQIRTFADEQQVHVVVADTGCGIPEDELDRIFEPGFTTKCAGVGTGLGLAISREIVRDHRGVIAAESQVGAGTRFTVSIPRERSRLAHQGSVATCQNVR